MRKILSLCKFQINNALAFLLYYTGILFLLKHFRLKHKAVVLMYHRILPSSDRAESFSQNTIMVDPIRFKRQITFLTKHFSLVDVRTFAQHCCESIPFPNATCLITFDDAWQDNYQYAFPILQKYRAPALIFVPINYIETGKLFWQEAMGHGFYQLLKSTNPHSAVFLHQQGLAQCKGLPEPQSTQRIIEKVRANKVLPYEEIDSIIRQQTTILGESIDCGQVDSYLDWARMQQMQNGGIAFGSHACSHRVLTRLSTQEVTKELSESKQKISIALGVAPIAMAYPDGDNNDAVRAIAASIGYKIGFGTEYGLVSHNDNRFNLKRINMNDRTANSNPLLLMAILGLF